jgi:hypothetical protein
LRLLFDLEETEREGRRLDEIVRPLIVRGEEKQRISREVRGGLPLLEGAARFRDLTLSGGPVAWKQFREVYPGDDDERFCRQVISYVEAWLSDEDPAECPAVVARLNEELERHRHEGTLRLRPVRLGDTAECQ